MPLNPTSYPKKIDWKISGFGSSWGHLNNAKAVSLKDSENLICGG
jgi:hypothetical protein